MTSAVQAKAARRHARVLMGRLLELIGETQREDLSSDMQRFRKGAVQLLLSADRRSIREPLDTIAWALNRQVYFVTTAVSSDLKGLAQFRESPDHVFKLIGGLVLGYDSIRRAAELLMEYLQVIRLCEPVHTFCQLDTCDAIVLRARGTRKFCSADHRKQFWSYKERPEYYKEKQKQNRQARERLRRRSHTGKD